MQPQETIIDLGLKHLIQTGLPWPRKPLSRAPAGQGNKMGLKASWVPHMKGDKIHRMPYSRKKKSS